MKKLKTMILAVMLTFSMGAMFATAGEIGQTKTGTVPGVIQVKDPVSGDWIVRAGATACQNLTSQLPAFCLGAGAGGVIFNVSELNSQSAHVVQGNLTATVITCNPCGYLKVTLGNDRDDDGIVTNVDAGGDDDGPNKTDHHGTNASFDDQSASCVMYDPKAPGDMCTIQFCFADDTDHSWDSWAVFLVTEADNPNVGTAELELENADPVDGDNISKCSDAAQANTDGKNKTAPQRPPGS